MPPPSALSKMPPWLRDWLLSDNYRSIQADLYNIEETNEGPCRSKRLGGRISRDRLPPRGQDKLGHRAQVTLPQGWQ